MRFHVLSLPHTHTTAAYSSCAYTQKVRKFCKMMVGRGHEVFLYSPEENDAPCTEHIHCGSSAGLRAATAGKHYTEASFDPRKPWWVEFNGHCIAALERRLQPRDFICVIAGTAQQIVAQAFPNHMTVEFGVGYSGTFSRYRVWESYAWMHANYGPRADGQFFDAVIPNYFDRADFPFVETPSNYFLYLGRIIDRKGYKIACEVCEKLGRKLILAGPGKPAPSLHGTFIGEVGPAQRAKLLGNAVALFAPTIYIEPFGGVTAEAMLCGTPVITTDWGAFTENVPSYVGSRCRTLKEFCAAAEDAPLLDRATIREYAASRFSLEAVAPQYERYFERLHTLWEEGWYAG